MPWLSSHLSKEIGLFTPMCTHPQVFSSTCSRPQDQLQCKSGHLIWEASSWAGFRALASSMSPLFHQFECQPAETAEEGYLLRWVLKVWPIFEKVCCNYFSISEWKAFLEHMLRASVTILCGHGANPTSTYSSLHLRDRRQQHIDSVQVWLAQGKNLWFLTSVVASLLLGAIVLIGMKYEL